MAEQDDSAESVDSLLAAVARIPVQWQPPADLDEYRLIRPLGQGGMGSVWLAEDGLLHRLVAIKFIAHGEPDPHTRERFAIEARAAARLQHVNVVTVYRFGEVAGRPYLVSEYIRGEALDKLAKPVPWQKSLELGIALARGLAAAHRAGIVHRDIKPANAILAADGDVKLVDFGLAKLGMTESSARAAGTTSDSLALGSAPDVGTADTELTKPGTIAGTPRYLAPETRAGGAADRRSDVFQVGCILYELVTGRAPSLDVKDGADASLASHVDESGARFAAVVDRCLRRDPAQRFASGDDLREALERIAQPVSGGELPEGNPYRGLLAFDAEHRALFFGRGVEIRAVIERLRGDAFVLVTGDSGAGKSSLCRAGVVPHVVDGALADGRAWTAVSLVPGRHPVIALASAVARALSIDEASLAKLCVDRPGDVPRELRRVLGAQRGLLVFVDQLEELVTLATRDEALAIAHVLAQLAAGIPGVKLLATVRSDFLTRVAELPLLGAELTRALYLLPPLSADGAREAIVGPAHAKGARFESERLVDTLVAAVAEGRAIELPLLAFTLAQLWDARDDASQTINSASLEAIGGVRGALARHADGVLAALLPAQRETARKLLLRLVTPERTRARRSVEELAAFDRAVLDALVRGRLVAARGEAFELAHERMIDGWPTLASWLADDHEAHAAHARLAAAATDWERLDRAKERLWGERQLVDLARLVREELTASEAAFADASRRALRRRRIARITAAIAIPALLAGVYGGTRLVAKRDVERRVAAKLGDSVLPLSLARQSADGVLHTRARAFEAFDAGDVASGEQRWSDALTESATARTHYTTAARALEAAYLIDTSRSDVRRQLAAVTFERVQLAEREFRTTERDELAARLALYDDGTLAKQLTAPATLDVRVEPRATLSLVDLASAKQFAVDAPVAPGSYVLIAHAPGHATATLPLLLRAGERKTVELALPPATAVPEGFVFVPPGSFLYGSRDDEALRVWFGTAPMHEMKTGAYLIARTETTYAQWIEFLEDIDATERAVRTPRIDVSQTVQAGGTLELWRASGIWQLQFAPTSKREYNAAAGAPIEYAERTSRQRQDWLRMPVSGITPQDAEAYAAWLARTGRVPKARLCTESEWERAARGADGRSYPHGERLLPDDTNIDVTYGQKEGGFGMDEVGVHAASRSPLGLADASGNVWEITRALSGTEFVMRGGGFYTDAKTAHLANRSAITPTFEHLHAGVRICADL